MGDVVSLADKLERWQVTYVSPCGSLRVQTSNHGRIKFNMTGQTHGTLLDFIDSVSFLSQVSIGMEDAMKEM